MQRKECQGCMYCQKRYRTDRLGRYTSEYHGCNFLPHWGTPIENIKVCPKITYKSGKSSLKNVCKSE